MSDLTLKSAFEYGTYTSSSSHKTILMTTVQAPKFESEQRKSRSACDIICVIDRSGSMGGEKIELVKKTLAFMVDQLKDDDQVSLVTFDTTVNVDFPLTKMNAKGKTNGKEIIKAVYAGDSTNLSGGIFQGFEVIKSRAVKNQVVSMLVFTDGQANVGIKDQALVNAVEKCVTDAGIPISLYTFGFGNDHDAQMLTKMATAGNGLYYYLQSEEDIPDSFSNCLGGLLSVVAQNITVTVQSSAPSAKITQVLSSFKKTSFDESKAVLAVGDLYSEERRDIVFEVELPALSEPNEAYVPFQVELKYFDVIETALKNKTISPTVARSLTVDTSTNLVNEEVDKQRNRVVAVKAMAEARELANKNNLAAARKVLQEAINVNTTSPSYATSYTKALNEDLSTCLDQMQDTQTYNSTGSKWINQNWSSNAMQRVTTTKSAVQANFYQQPQQQAMQADFAVLKTPKAPSVPKHPAFMSPQPQLPFFQQQQQQNPFATPSPFPQQQQLPSQIPPYQGQPYPTPYQPQQQLPYTQVPYQQPNPFAQQAQQIPPYQAQPYPTPYQLQQQLPYAQDPFAQQPVIQTPFQAPSPVQQAPQPAPTQQPPAPSSSKK